MQYRRLGRSDIEVSTLCLGSMTWGEQNSEAEGFEQMDYAFEQGVNFIDTAEMYAVPPRAETQGTSEQVIGNWMQARGNRDKVILATKVVGPSARFSYIREGDLRLNRQHVKAAIEASLKRLKTDYIDLYQLHWPERNIDSFGVLGYEHRDDDLDATPMEETLAALDEQVKAGTIRTVGLSNETPWGTMRFLHLAEQGLGPRMASVQNPYNLLNRSFETRLAEVAIREHCGLLAYAPVAAGVLSGKYLNGQKPSGARLTLWPDNRRYQGPKADQAVTDYVALAQRFGLDPAQMALAFVLAQPFLTSAIIGATQMAQLKNNMAAVELELAQEVLEGLEEVHKQHTYPCP